MAGISALVVGLTLSLWPTLGRATTLLSENFDELTPQQTATAIGNFSAVNGTNVDIVGGLNGSFFPQLCSLPESGNCIDLDGTSGNPQGVLQSNNAITLAPGVTYLLSFNLIGSQRGNTASTTVSFGPYSQTFDLASGDNTSGIVVNTPITVASTTSAFLTFTSNTSGLQGNVLDDILVTSNTAVPAPTTVPEPASLVLLIAGLLGFGLTRRTAT